MNSGWSRRHLGRITCGLILLCLGWPACPVAPSSVAAPPIQGQMQVGDQPPLRLAPDQAAPTTLHLNAAPPPLTFSLQTEAHMAYRYRLTGWDARWHPLPAGSSVIRYAALPPGHYRFQLQSALTGAASPLAQCDIWVAAGHWRSATWIPPLALLAILLLWAGYRWPRRTSGLQHPVHSPPPQSPLACQGALASELRESLQLLTPPLATLQAVGDPAVWPVANQVARGVSRLQGLLGQLIQLSQSTDPVWSERQTLILRSWLSPRLEQYRQQAQAHQVDWQTAMPPDIAVTLEGPLLDHLLRVLLAQTLALAGPGGAIHLAICLDESQNQLVLRLQGRAPVSRVSPTKAADGERLEIRLLQQQVQQQGGQLNELDQALGETGWQVRLPCLWTRLNWLAPHQTPPGPALGGGRGACITADRG
ncbi:MAG: hypothetical protein LRY38_09715 [Aeromonadaceae bacterium]|nr:hypothetical protein [Aeromonadaceae bacterium]